MKKINGTEIARIVAERNGFTIKQTYETMIEVFAEIREQVRQGNKVMIVGTGTFRQRIVSPGVSVNPKTGETVPRKAAVKLHLSATKVDL
jgi:nucleoid DNA-binding protein